MCSRPYPPDASTSRAAAATSHARNPDVFGGECEGGMTNASKWDYSALMATKLDELFLAERTVRRLHAELASQGKKLVPEIAKRTRAALEEGDTDDAAATLVRLSVLLGEIEGPEAVDLLVDILGGESAEARAVAGEELENIAFERFKEVALGIERALARLPKDSPALTELPFQNASAPAVPLLSICCCSNSLVKMMYQLPIDMITMMISVPRATKSPCVHRAFRP